MKRKTCRDRLRARMRVWRWLLTDMAMRELPPSASAAAYLAHYATRWFDRVLSLRLLMVAHRYRPTERKTKRVVHQYPDIIRKLGELLGANEPATVDDRAVALIARRTIVLKWPRRHGNVIERGVILVSFTTSFSYFYHHTDLESLLRWFTVVLEPSWAGYCLEDILLWSGPGFPPVVVQATERRDFEFLRRLDSNLVPVEFGASNWVDDRVFRKLDGVTKRYDVIYVANYKPVKRHHVLFRAVKEIGDPSFKVALVCTPWGGTRRTVLDLIEYYGIERNVDIYEGISAAALNELMNASKVSVLLSLKEGSNRGIFEGFFADVPAVVLENNVGVNKAYINERTGRLVGERALARTLLHFREHWREFRPREWAIERIAAPVTTRALQEILVELADRERLPWTVTLRTKVNRPEVEYYEVCEPFPLTSLELLQAFDRRGRGRPAIEQLLFRSQVAPS
jgi:glycosyltransferase involved in cell wall biosynthesis